MELIILFLIGLWVFGAFAGLWRLLTGGKGGEPAAGSVTRWLK